VLDQSARPLSDPTAVIWQARGKSRFLTHLGRLAFNYPPGFGDSVASLSGFCFDVRSAYHIRLSEWRVEHE
jgi:hypothetical protein